MEKQVYEEKEVLQDALYAQKAATSLYNLGANECVNSGLRDTMMDLLEKEHDIQFEVFNIMHDKGYYPTPDAVNNKVQQAKQKFECSYQAAV